MIFSNDELSQIFGTKDIYVDKIHQQPYSINGINKEDPILYSLIDITLGTLYNKFLYEYCNEIVDYEDIEISLDLRDAIHEEMDDNDLNIFEKYKHKDFWKWQLHRAIDGEIKLKEKKIKSKEIIDYHFPELPNKFLNNILPVLRSDAINVFTKHDLDTILDFCGCEDSSIYSIRQYEKEIFTEGHLLNDLYNISNDAIGKGEVVSCFLYKDSTINGITASFDLQLQNTEYGVEIKAPKMSSFRIGVNGSIGSSFFFTEILEARKKLRILIKQLGKKRFKEYVGEDFFELSKQLLTEGDYRKERALSSAIDYAELSATRLELIKLWFYLANKTIGWLSDNKSGVYLDEEFGVYRCKYGDMTKNTTDYDVLTALTFLRYVKNPELFEEDLQLEVNGWFKHIGVLVVFNEKEKTISIYESPEEIVVDAISQNGFKVIEKKYRKNVNKSMDIALQLCEINPERNFYQTYCEIDSKFNRGEDVNYLLNEPAPSLSR